MMNLTWQDFHEQLERLADRLTQKRITHVYGIPSGGCFVAMGLKSRGFSMLEHVPQKPSDTLAVVDDICDSGKTLKVWRDQGYVVDSLWRSKHSLAKELVPHAAEVQEWVVFPWEASSRPEDNVTRILQYLGEDPNREDLIETPKRYLEALREMTSGYRENPAEILRKQFNPGYDEMIVESGIEFVSLCEHHMLPFFGVCAVGYLPKNGYVVGASKLARLVHVYAKRFQIQERMTYQIAHALQEYVPNIGVGVVVKAHHLCMSARGVRQKNTELVTSCLLGRFRDSDVKSEFLSLCNQMLFRGGSGCAF